MKKLTELIEENRVKMTDFSTILPNIYGNGITRWTVKWDRKTGGVAILHSYPQSSEKAREVKNKE